ncbi:LysR family transcriptional regulator [Vibrio sinensis]|uniref:LysR family transcriptional regulator n=1 Tax=Vibrio sinensis TaxID=2302434 RepID=A0A3A6QK80_9VIBR|nr:LysR substrate-binding domain-containing protein [Vibrio sinensis]RJX68433.1 LysR family transcriptional regulator [Vibrio sinensis]
MIEHSNSNHVSRVPHLAWFMAFKAVADRQSFTLASRDLHLTQPAVSQQVSKLESLLKTKLFFRSSRKVIMTEDGQRLYDQIDMPFNALLNVVDEFHDKSNSYNLNIETEPVFSRLFISQYLPGFLKQLDYVLVRQVLTTHHLDFLPETELAIKWGEGRWEGFDAQFLFGLNYVPVCSPQYAQENNLLAPSDLAKAVLLHERDSSDWKYWHKHYPIQGMDTKKGHVAGESDVVMSMAMAGLGVALCGQELVQQHLESNTLIMPFAEMHVRHHRAYYILTRKNSQLSKEAVAFIKYLHAQIIQ